MSRQKQIKMPEEFLVTHWWSSDLREGSENHWNHPLDFKPPNGYPVGWRLEEAVKIELNNQQWKLLEAEGWDIEWGGLNGPNGTYYGYIGKVRSPKGGRRRILTVSGAFKTLQTRGWEKIQDPTLPAVRKNTDLFVWCRYCVNWHRHGTNEPLPNLGDDAGHRSSHCNTTTAYSGYYLRIGLVTPEGLPPYRIRRA